MNTKKKALKGLLILGCVLLASMYFAQTVQTITTAKVQKVSATRGKLEAARALGLRVIMVQRPQVPARASTDQVDAVMHWLAHAAVPGATASLP